MSAEHGWISIVGWDDFQHYKDRNPLWIKNYTRLMRDDDYLALSEHCALILHRLWLEYASSSSRLHADTRSLSRRLALRVTKSHLEALNHAGFIRIVASKSLAEGYQPASTHATRGETETETETEKASQGETVVRPLVHDPDSDLEERDKEHEEEEPFAIGPEPALPSNGSTADQHGPQPLEPDQLLERWRTA